MPFDIDKLIPIYQENIDLLLAELGKPVKVVFEKVIQSTTNANRDDIRRSSKKPSFKNDAPTVQEEFVMLNALTQHSTKPYEDFGIRVDNNTSIVKLKTYMTDIPTLMKAKYIIPNFTTAGIIHQRYKLHSQPKPQGLKIDRYAVTFWEPVGG